MSEIERLERELEELRATPTPRVAPFVEAFARIAADVEDVRQALMRPEINIDVPAPVVEHVPAAEVRVDVPDQTAALSALTEALASLLAALQEKEMSVTVTVPENAIQVSVADDDSRPRRVTFERKGGAIVSATIEGA